MTTRAMGRRTQSMNRKTTRAAAAAAPTPGRVRGATAGAWTAAAEQKSPETIDYTVVETPFGPIGVAATRRGLCALAPLTRRDSRGRPDPEPLLALARRGRPGARISAHEGGAPLPPRLAEGVEALASYAAGDRRPYRGALDLSGTPFQQAVWRRLLDIPCGTTITYGELAAAVGRPGAARAVGAAVGANPVSLLVPCHRVVGARGALTGFGWGLAMKRALLAHEQAPARELRPRAAPVPDPPAQAAARP